MTDCDNYRVQKFFASGIFRDAWIIFTPEDGQFYKPLGVAVGGGNLMVTDAASSSVLIFSAPSSSLTMLELLLD